MNLYMAVPHRNTVINKFTMPLVSNSREKTSKISYVASVNAGSFERSSGGSYNKNTVSY